MARPYKTGLDYFPLDVHLDDDIELFEAECGLIGYAILIKLWQKIYAEGYYIKWDNDSVILFAKRNNTDVNKINEIINACLRRKLFNNDLYQKHKILTSKAIQKRYFSACKDSKRKNTSAIKEYLLVNGEYLELITELTELTPEKTPVNTGESTQSKVKEIESKVKESIIEKTPCFQEIINYLNQKAGTKYKVTASYKDHMSARIREGATFEDFKTVIDKKVKSWTGTEYEKFIRPHTLFGTKFDSYLNEKEPKQKSGNYFKDIVEGGTFDEQN